MTQSNFNIHGLSNQQVIASRKQYGSNQTDYKKESGFWNALKSITQEPMIILLLLASTIYFIIGDVADGIFLASAILLDAVTSIAADGIIVHSNDFSVNESILTGTL